MGVRGFPLLALVESAGGLRPSMRLRAAGGSFAFNKADACRAQASRSTPASGLTPRLRWRLSWARSPPICDIPLSANQVGSRGLSPPAAPMTRLASAPPGHTLPHLKPVMAKGLAPGRGKG
jgi:hypothetical protein